MPQAFGKQGEDYQEYLQGLGGGAAGLPPNPFLQPPGGGGTGSSSPGLGVPTSNFGLGTAQGQNPNTGLGGTSAGSNVGAGSNTSGGSYGLPPGWQGGVNSGNPPGTSSTFHPNAQWWQNQGFPLSNLQGMGLPQGQGPGQTEFLRNLMGMMGATQFGSQLPIQTGLSGLLSGQFGQGYNPFQGGQTSPFNFQGPGQNNLMSQFNQANPFATGGRFNQGQYGMGDGTGAGGNPWQLNAANPAGQFGFNNPLTGATQQAALGNLQNAPDVNALMGQIKQQTIGDINESSAARGAFGGGVNQDQLSRSLGQLNLQGLGLQQQMQNQALNNALGTQGQLFGQGATGFGLNQDAQNQAFNQQFGQFGANLGAQGQRFGQGLQGFQANQGAQQQDFMNRMAQTGQLGDISNQLFGQGLGQAGFNQGVGQQNFMNQQMPLQYAMNFLGMQNPAQGMQGGMAQPQQNPWLSMLGQFGSSMGTALAGV